MITPKHCGTGWGSLQEIAAQLLLAVLMGSASRVQAGATPADPIRALCIDFNWGEGGPNGFARPGLWAGASLEAIDRQALVKRHNIEWNDPGGQVPLGNGGLLYAVAMMAAGWDGAPTRPAPGFPDDATWVGQWEGLSKAP